MLLYFMKAGFYQFDPIFGDKKRNILKAADAIRRIDADLVVLPEFFATGYQFCSGEEVADLSEDIPEGMTTQSLVQIAAETRKYVAAGLPEKAGSIFFNSAILAGPEGFVGLYRKTHLFSEEKLFFSPGDTGFRVWDTPLGRIGVMICFDWYFPESLRTLALRGVEIVAHPSNLVLPHCPQSMPVRCRENRVFVVTANRTGAEERRKDARLKYIGQSQVVSPLGDVLLKAPEEGEMAAAVSVDPEQARDKSLNRYNDLFADRRPGMYER